LFLALRLIVPCHEYTPEDVQILGDTMWLENGHTGKTEEENLKVLILTGAVVVNRVKSDDPWWHKTGAKTVYDVVYASGQYAKATRDKIGKTDTPQWVYDLAEEILKYGTTVPEYVIYQSQQPNLGTRWCPPIAGEYFATARGHKNEGENWDVRTRKKEYQEAAIREMVKEWNKSFKKIVKRLRKLLAS
jgi:hypothetical protein